MALFPKKRFVWDEPIEWTRMKRKKVRTMHRSFEFHMIAWSIVTVFTLAYFLGSFLRNGNAIAFIPAVTANIFGGYLISALIIVGNLSLQQRVEVCDEVFQIWSVPKPMIVSHRQVDFIDITAWGSFYLMRITLKSGGKLECAIPSTVDMVALCEFLNEKGLLRL